MEGTSRCTVGSMAQYTHYLEDHTQSIQQSTSTHCQHLHNIQQQNNNHTQTYCELFHQTINKHATHKTNRSINRSTQKIQGYNITLTTTQVQEAINQSKNNSIVLKRQIACYLELLNASVPNLTICTCDTMPDLPL